MVQTVFYLIVGIIVFDFIFEQVLNYLNTTRWSEQLPDKLRDIYDDLAYKKSQEYKKINHKFEMITSSFSFLIIIIMLLFNGFALVNGWVLGITGNIILSSLIFFGILGLASDILTTPFSLYDIFIIEERFGFNKTTPKTFIYDKIKGWILAGVLGGGLLSFIIFIWSKTGNNFWLWAWVIITAITLFMTMFYSNLIVPLFNKQTTLAEGELKQLIHEFSVKAGFKLKNIYVIDGSKRSTKANAYFTGIGPKKRIVLYDTLINDLSKEEIVAVLAHEIGHYKKKHTLIGLFSGIVQTGIMLYVFSLLVSSPILSNALGVEEPRFYIGLIAFGILYSPLSFVIGIFMNIISRKNEYQADAFASQFGFARELASGLKKLSVNNLSNLTPHPLYVFFHYSHPTLLQRLERLENQKL
jgi:STE24 endopeptidase